MTTYLQSLAIVLISLILLFSTTNPRYDISTFRSVESKCFFIILRPIVNEAVKFSIDGKLMYFYIVKLLCHNHRSIKRVLELTK